MEALSIALFNTPIYYQQLESSCQKHFTFLLERNHLTCQGVKHYRYLTEEGHLNLISHMLRIKILLHSIISSEIDTLVVNNGFIRKIELAQIQQKYFAIKKLGFQDSSKFIRNILETIIFDNFQIRVSEPHHQRVSKHKRSISDPYLHWNEYVNDDYFIRTNGLNKPLSPDQLSNRVSLITKVELDEQISPQKIQVIIKTFSTYKSRGQYIDEINEEGDKLMEECNSIISEKEHQLQFDTPQKPTKSQQNSSEKNEIFHSSGDSYNQLSTVRFTGTLKFFDESKCYGFLIMDLDRSDIFVHQDDLLKAGISKEYLNSAKLGNRISFSFNILQYFGKYQVSRKAVDLIYTPPVQIVFQPIYYDLSSIHHYQHMQQI